MKKIFLTCALLCLSTPAMADDDRMDLFPNQRASHAAKMDSQAAQYQADGYSYIENLYEYKGEGGGRTSVSTPITAPMMPEADLDAYINGTASLNDSVNADAPTDAPPLPTKAQ